MRPPVVLTKWLLVSAACALVLSPSCTGNTLELAGTSWVLDADSEHAVVAGLGLTKVTVEFAADGSLTGAHAYLKYGGSYSAEDGTLSITDVCWTSMACQAETGLAAQQSYLDALMTAQSYSVQGDVLTIDTGDDELVFRRAEE